MMRRSWRSKALIAVLILDLSAWLACTALSQSFFRKAAPPANPAVGHTNPDEPRHLGNFTRLPGTSILMATIHSSGGGSRSSFTSYSSGHANPVHNYAFLDLSDRSLRRLLDANNSLILNCEQLPRIQDGDPIADPDSVNSSRVRWLLFDVIKQDTNQDKQIDEKDLRTLAVSDANGRNYTELIGGVSHVFGKALSDPTTLVVIYQGTGGKSVSVIDLSKRTLTSTTAVPDLGLDVK